MPVLQQKTIIWDWNGTLLDDADICLESINTMLKARNLPRLTLASYREVFTFPVIEYYKKVGFDFTLEPWEPVAMEFINLYLNALPACGLSMFAVETLQGFREKGYRQAIVSAMEHEELIKSVTKLGIHSYFEFIGGIGDHYAGGKIENARNYLAESGLDPAQTTLIGDTIHDSEVANELQCNCILVATGHQSVPRLRETGRHVITDLSGINHDLL